MKERNSSDEWRVLLRCDDVDRARAVATTVASMDYEVRVEGSRGIWGGTSEEHPGHGPYTIRVHEGDYPELREVLNEMIAEQEEFDEMLARRARRSARLERRIMLIVLIIVMVAMAAFGLLRL